LQWKHINTDCTEIYFCESYGFFGRKGTKTGGNRKFPCNSQLQEFLLLIRPCNYSQDSLVFPSPVDGQEEINTNSFGRAWRGDTFYGVRYPGVITQLIEQGKVARYRVPYNCRHTFITACLERNVPVQTVARWVGNSPNIIYRHYAGVVSNVSVPEL
jgi:integrase